MKKSVLDFLDDYIDKNVVCYKSDWTIHDRPRVENCNTSDRFIIMVRKTGIDTMFIDGPEVSYVNLLWAKACLDQERSDSYLFYDGDDVCLSSHDKALKFYRETFDKLPQKYIEDMKEAFDNHERCLTVNEWEKVKEVKLDTVALKLICSGHINLAREYMDRLKAFALGEDADTFSIHVSSITPERLYEAERSLAYYGGIDFDESSTVMQALGYILVNKELYPEDSQDAVWYNSDSLETFKISDVQRKKAIKCLKDNGVPKEQVRQVLDRVGMALFNHRISTVVDDIKDLGIKVPKVKKTKSKEAFR